MDTAAFLDAIRRKEGYQGQAVHVHQEPARAARYAEPAAPLTKTGRQALDSLNVERLYTHQTAAVDAVRDGRDILVVTGTASGKTLCYLLPVLEALEGDPGARILALYPTKALSQDQFRTFTRTLEAVELEGVTAGVIDGDTPSGQRRKARDLCNVIITNPDMLHAGILPQHPRWANVFASLRYVIIDELHTYSGVFGSNVANLFRRLERVCERNGSRPQFICCSATIGNPLELAHQVTGRDMLLIDDDGSPRGPRTFVFWNPPQVRNRRWRARRSANVEANELMVELIRSGAATITFSKAKVTAELITRYVRETLEKEAPGLAPKVAPYRGGYLPEERRAIEKRLFDGDLLGVSTTRALELGIDIGGLDACLIVGYPGTLASFFQQAGRAGRRAKESLVVLIGLDTTVNQYVMRNPDYIFGRAIEQTVLEPENPYVLLGQLRCACHELPLRKDEIGVFGPDASLVLEVLSGQHKVYPDRGAWYHSASEVPQHEVSLRDYADRNVAIIDTSDNDRVIGQLNKFDAQPIIHRGAIYLHQGDTYLVEELDLQRYLCKVRKVDVDYYTQPLGGTDIHHIDHQLREKPFGTGTLYFGEVTAYFRNTAYERISFYTLDALSVHDLDMPNYVLETMAFWIVPPEETCKQVLESGLDPHRGLRGIGYATRMILPLFVRCQTLDFSHTIGAMNAPWQTIFVYERYPHGLGFTERAYEIAGRLLPAVYEHVKACDCRDGCPCCVGKPLRQYTTWNVERGEASIPSKKATLMILEGLLGDGSSLELPDSNQLAEDAERDRVLMQEGLRRRLERMREPEVFHPIQQEVRTEQPEPERRSTLALSDVARRAFRRKLYDRSLRNVTRSETGEPQQPIPDKAVQSMQGPSPKPEPPSHAGKGSIIIGNTLAGRARKRGKTRE